MFEKDYFLNEILERLFKKGKIRKREIWVVKKYINDLKKENKYYKELAQTYRTHNTEDYKKMIKLINILIERKNDAIKYIKECLYGNDMKKLLEILEGEK